MKSEERGGLPSVEFGFDYNNLRALTLEHHPVLAQLMPPEVTISRDTSDSFGYTVHRYPEIATFCQQICELLTKVK